MPKRKAAAKNDKGSKNKKQKTRKGYQSVARTRGAQVTGEMKYFDSELAATAIAASADWTGTEYDPGVPTASQFTLFAPAVGAGINQRIGKSANVHTVKVKGMVHVPAQANQTGADVSSVVRIALVHDTQTNAAQAQGEQIFTDPTTNENQIALCSFQQVNNFGRFKVIKDKLLQMRMPMMSWDGTNIEQQGFSIPFKFTVQYKKPIVVRFNATNGGTVADIVDNSWHIIANTDNATLVPAISYQARVCFKE